MKLAQDRLKPKKRRFHPSDVEAIARILAKRGTEKGACELLGINYDSWRGWKSRPNNNLLFSSTFTRIRETILIRHVDNIESAAINGLGNDPRPDWRASKAIIELTHPELDPKNAPTTTSPQSITITVLADALKRIYADPQPAETVDVDEIKAIPAPLRRSIPKPPKVAST